MPDKKLDILKQLADEKNSFIIDQLAKLESLIEKAAGILNDMLLADFINKLNTEDGNITSDQANIQKVNLIEQIWNRYQQSQGLQVISVFVNDLKEIMDLGRQYYVELIDDKIPSDEIEKILNHKLGLKWEGEDWVPTPKGYINSLIADTTIRTELKQIAFNNIIAKSGYNSLKTAFKEYTIGDGEDKGELHNFYKQFAFDTYSQVDRLNSHLHADRLGLKYFLYAGGVVDGSREFCKERHGKVFSIKEAEKWRELIGKFIFKPGKLKKVVKVPIGPIWPDSPDTYEPIRDLGGVFCRHSSDFVSEEIAKMLRKDL